MFVIGGLERGGAESQLVSIANGLGTRGWRVTVLSYQPFSENSLRSKYRESPDALLTLNASGKVRKLVSFFLALLEVRRQRPDIVVGFMFHGMMTARIPRGLIRSSAKVSAVRSERHSPLREKLIGLTDRMTDAVTVQSRVVAEALCRRGVTSASRIRVIPNSVNLETFASDGSREDARRELGIAENQFLWLAAGRLAAAKDYPTMLGAFAVLTDRCPQAMLAIAGDGPLRGEIKSLVQQMGLAERVRLLGLRSDVPRLLQASDALVLSSAWEGMPVVVLEAMASRRPVVATSVASIPEMLEDGISGLLVPPGDSEALADAMVKLMDADPEDRRAMTEKAYERVRTTYSEDVVIGQWESLFHELLRKNER